MITRSQKIWSSFRQLSMTNSCALKVELNESIKHASTNNGCKSRRRAANRAAGAA
jgi:hypothetical protein